MTGLAKDGADRMTGRAHSGEVEAQQRPDMYFRSPESEMKARRMELARAMDLHVTVSGLATLDLRGWLTGSAAAGLCLGSSGPPQTADGLPSVYPSAQPKPTG